MEESKEARKGLEHVQNITHQKEEKERQVDQEGSKASEVARRKAKAEAKLIVKYIARACVTEYMSGAS